jgi:hypothetical protein
LTNASTRPVSGTVNIVSDTGATGSETVTVPPSTQQAVDLAPTVSGWWVAARIDLNGGGVAATESVHGPNGWSQAPCAGETSPNWYFASGSTAAGHDLFISLFNPTVTLAVANLRFTGPDGVQEPAPFQQIVVPARGLVVADVGSYVQDDPSVATSVVTLSGRIVADALEVSTRSQPGVSLRLGSEAPTSTWSAPRTLNVTGGTAELHVFNPTSVPEQVGVSFRLPSGTPAPITQQLPADSTWVLALSDTSRLPHNDNYSVTVHATGGPGVVVDRVIAAPVQAPAPRWGAAPLVDSSLWDGTTSWLLPGPGTPGHPAVAGATPYSVSLSNPGTHPVTVGLHVVTPAGQRVVASGLRLSPGSFTVLGPAALQPAGLLPMMVTATGPVAVSEDLSPSGAPGVVSMPGLPLG